MFVFFKSKKVLESIFDVVFDDKYKNQVVVWKLVMDRIFFVVVFEKDVVGNSGCNVIQINIMGVGEMKIVFFDEEDDNVIEVDYE